MTGLNLKTAAFIIGAYDRQVEIDMDDLEGGVDIALEKEKRDR